jgi:hypothetical protein
MQQHIALYASVQMQNISIFICQAYVLICRYSRIILLSFFSFLSCLFTPNKLHADRTPWNGCFAVVHLSRFTLQVVFFVPDVLFLLHYFNSSSMHVFHVKVHKINVTIPIPWFFLDNPNIRSYKPIFSYFGTAVLCCILWFLYGGVWISMFMPMFWFADFP